MRTSNSAVLPIPKDNSVALPIPKDKPLNVLVEHEYEESYEQRHARHGHDIHGFIPHLAFRELLENLDHETAAIERRRNIPSVKDE